MADITDVWKERAPSIFKIETNFLLQTETVVISESGPGSSVGIATELRAGRSGIESR